MECVILHHPNPSLQVIGSRKNAGLGLLIRALAIIAAQLQRTVNTYVYVREGDLDTWRVTSTIKIPTVTGSMAVPVRIRTGSVNILLRFFLCSVNILLPLCYYIGRHDQQSISGLRMEERGHAMIVEYEKDTETVMHHHPDAESMFVPLTGNIRFFVNGEPIVLKRGQAVYFPINDRHALPCAEGTTSASFLEFHIPGAFTTVKEQK